MREKFTDSKTRRMTPMEYVRAFGLDNEDKSMLKAAFDHARDNRKFEIDLYWKRATYFWTLIAAAFAGYFAVLVSDKSAPPSDEKLLLAFAISCIGFVFTFAWFQVNRGSKQWQENWENHVDMLEDKITGPLYKTVMVRPLDSDDADFFAKHVTGPERVSVSKVNQIINLFTIVMWGLLALHVSGLAIEFRPVSIERLVLLSITIGFCWLITTKCATHLGDHQHVAYLRETRILDGERLNEPK